MADQLQRLSDSALVSRAQLDDRDAYGELTLRYRALVCSAVLGRLGNHHDVQDVAQAAFVRGFICIRQLTAQQSFRPWITRVAIREAQNRLRAAATTKRVQMDVHDPANALSAETTEAEDWERNTDMQAALDDILQILPEALRTPLLMRYIGGGQHREIAEALATTENGVQKTISRAIKVLRKHLRDTGKGDEYLDLLRTRGIGFIAGADFVAKTMQRVSSAPPPAARHAGAAPGELMSCVAAAVATVGVIASAFVGGAASEAAAWPVAGGSAEISVAGGSAGPALSSVATPRSSAYEARLTQAMIGAGWSAGLSAYDAGVPGAAADNPDEIHVTNATGTYHPMDPARGKVILDLEARPPYHQPAEVVISLDINHGDTGSYTSYPEIVKTKDNWWACAGDDAALWGAKRTEFEPLRKLARYTGEKTRIRLIHYTEKGEYDIYIDDKLVAEGVQRRWAVGLPVTGLTMRSGDAMWPGTGKVTAISSLNLVVDPIDARMGRPPAQTASASSRNINPNLPDLKSGLVRAVEMGNLGGIQSVLADLAATFPTDPLRAQAEENYAEIVAPALALRGASDARARILPEAVRAIVPPEAPLARDDLHAAFDDWATKHAAATELWLDAATDGPQGAIWSVRLPPEDYRGSMFLLDIAYQLALAYERMGGGPATVQVRPPNGPSRHILVADGTNR
jgi:RNA polymerase sigma-70 factor, ECF subfamily